MTPTLKAAMRWHRPLLVFAAAMAVLALISLGGVLFDDRLLLGAPIWLKPLKFSISFAAYSVTLAWMLSQITRGRRLASIAATFIALAGAAEMVPIVVQVLRGRRSHFNVATDLDNNLWIAMGITIGVLWTATFAVAVILFRTRMTDRANQWAIRLGILLALAGMGVAALMLRPTPAQEVAIEADMETIVGAHSVGVEDGGAAMAFTGWSTTGGDLRIPHFVGLHGLQALPLLALLLVVLAGSRWRYADRLDATRRLRLVLLAGAGYIGLIGLLTWQALRGQPLLKPDAATTITGLLLMGGAIAGTIAILALPTGRTRRQDVQPADRIESRS
jgi:hypothetical protein